MITQSDIYRDVAVNINTEERQPFSSARRNEELMWEHHENKNGCIEDCYGAKGSLAKVILDSRLGTHQEEPEDHSILF